MRPDRSFAVFGSGIYARGISDPGKQYAFYLHHSAPEPRGSYSTRPGDYEETVVVSLPAGSYRADWIDPASGRLLRTDELRHGGGNRTFVTPWHAVDIALAIRGPDGKS